MVKLLLKHSSRFFSEISSNSSSIGEWHNYKHNAYSTLITVPHFRETVRQMCERAKEYRNQLILAESDLDTNIAQEMKSDLTAVSLPLKIYDIRVIESIRIIVTWAQFFG